MTQNRRVSNALRAQARAAEAARAAASELDEAFEEAYGLSFGELTEEHPEGDDLVEAYEYGAGRHYTLRSVEKMVREVLKAREEGL